MVLLPFSALNAEQYDLKTTSEQIWKSVYSKKYMQYVAQINIEHHKLTVLQVENKLRLLFEPIFYYDKAVRNGKVINYYYKKQYAVHVDGHPFSVWQTCVDLHVIEGKPCEKTAQYYMMDLEEKDIDILKKGNEIWYDTSTFTDDLTFTFSLKGFTEAFNESFTKERIVQASAPMLTVKGDVEGVRKLLIEGLDPDYKLNGLSLLYMAALNTESNKEKMLRLLITAGADINTKNNKGDTILTALAHFSQDTSMFKLLLKLGADTEARDKNGRTTLDRTVNYDDELTKYKLLLKAGANVNAIRHDNGMSVLNSRIYHADYSDPIKDVKFLVEHGAKINTQYKNGDTPLMRSIRKRQTDTAIYLMQKGAIPFIENNAGETARTIALEISRTYKAKLPSKTQTVEQKTRIVRSNYKKIASYLKELDPKELD